MKPSQRNAGRAMLEDSINSAKKGERDKAKTQRKEVKVFFSAFGIDLYLDDELGQLIEYLDDLINPDN